MDFLNKWVYDEELYKNNKYPLWWDQGVLITMVEDNILDIKNNHISYDFNILQNFDQNMIYNNKRPFVLHMAGRMKSSRIEISKRYYEQLKDK